MLRIVIGLLLLAAAIAAVSSFVSSAASLDDFGPCLEKKLGEQLPCFGPLVEEFLSRGTAEELAVALEERYPRGCHSILHVVGRTLYEKSLSVEEALTQCSATCFSGCRHGVVAAVFSEGLTDEERDGVWHPEMDDLLAQARTLCTGADECHTVGHIFYQVIGSLTGALTACDEAAKESELVMCYRGVFMESMQQNLPFIDGVRIPEIVYRDPDRILSPCDAVPSRYSRACYHFLHINHTLTFEERGITDLNERARLFREACETLQPWDRASCFEGFGFEINDLPICESLSSLQDRSACMFGLSHFLTGDGNRARLGVERCGLVREEIPRRACFESIIVSVDTRSLMSLSELCTASSHPSCNEALARYLSDSSELVYDPRVILPPVSLPRDPVVR